MYYLNFVFYCTHVRMSYVLNAYLLTYLLTPPYIQPFGHNIHWPKSGGGVPQATGAELCPPSNTMCPWHSPTSVPSGILIHPTAWPQQTWTADYTDAGKACIPKLRNWGLLCPFPRGPVSTSNTMWFGPRPIRQPPHQVASYCI